MVKLLINTHEYSLKDEEWERIKPKFDEIINLGKGTLEFQTVADRKVEVAVLGQLTLIAQHVSNSIRL